MDRLIAQDPMIIPASSRGVSHTANIARRSPAKACTSPRMIGIRRERPDRRSMSPAPDQPRSLCRLCEPTFARFKALSRPRSMFRSWTPTRNEFVVDMDRAAHRVFVWERDRLAAGREGNAFDVVDRTEPF